MVDTPTKIEWGGGGGVVVVAIPRYSDLFLSEISSQRSRH